MNNGQESIVAYDEADKIGVYNMSGEEQWKSDDRFGGSMNYLEYPMHIGGARGDKGYWYLPERIFVMDVNKDGQNEVIVSHNKGSIGTLLARFRHFSNGRIVSLIWSRFALYPNFQTPGVNGYISDFDIGDFDNDGENEVVVAEVSKRGTLVTGARSSIIGYEVPQSAPVQ